MSLSPMIVWVLISLGQIRMMSWVAAMALADARKRVDEAGCSVLLAAANGASIASQAQRWPWPLPLTMSLRRWKCFIRGSERRVHGLQSWPELDFFKNESTMFGLQPTWTLRSLRETFRRQPPEEIFASIRRSIPLAWLARSPVVGVSGASTLTSGRGFRCVHISAR